MGELNYTLDRLSWVRTSLDVCCILVVSVLSLLLVFADLGFSLLVSCVKCCIGIPLFGVQYIRSFLKATVLQVPYRYLYYSCEERESTAFSFTPTGRIVVQIVLKSIRKFMVWTGSGPIPEKCAATGHRTPDLLFGGAA